MDRNGCYTLKEAKAYLKIGTNKMSNLLKDPSFPCVRLGRRVIVPVVELERWLSEQARRA